MSAHAIAVEALKRVPVRTPGEMPAAYAARLRLSIPTQPPLVPSKWAESAPPPSRAQLQWHVADKAAVLIGAAAALHEAFPEDGPALAANGRSKQAQNETMKLYMRSRRAKARAAKLAEKAAQ
jgi:hypothetical protein